MKIAIPSTGKELESLISHNLGRAPFIIIYDDASGEYNSVENPGFKIQHGSGPKAMEIILRNNADVLLTREIGRKAYSILMKEHIDIHLIKSSSTIKSAIKKLLKK